MMVGWLRSSGINRLVVGYHEDNPYQAFYLKMGGEAIDTGLCYWRDLTAWERPF